MNRREFVNMSTVTAAVMAIPDWGRADAADPLVVHIIRLQLAPGISAPMRAQVTASVNRFKQIHATTKMIVGRDVTPEGSPHFDLTQISLLKGVKGYHDYFYDPIHLAADREAYSATEKVFGAVTSFDTVSGGNAGFPAKLKEVTSGRDAKYKANDTRPTSPPVPDRAEDLRWNYGSRIFHVVRMNLSAMNDAQRAARFAAVERCKTISGVEQVVFGANANPNESDHFTHAMFVALASEDAYRNYLSAPLHRAQREAGGALPPGGGQWFDVTDPMNDGLAERLKKYHIDAGA
jgi:Stress responsive A/B Barrel Domain